MSSSYQMENRAVLRKQIGNVEQGSLFVSPQLFSKYRLVLCDMVKFMPHSILKTHFGYDEFRPLQEEIIEELLASKDALVLMPTGGGKSLCYQIPALLLPGITLVVSPLIALMKDQVDGLQANGVRAEALHSGLTGPDINLIMNQARRGQIKLLYVSPERLAVPAFQAFLKELTISLLAIDEAHCISEWGHDFRPDYRNLAALRKQYAGVPLVALTATATERVREDISTQLGLQKARTFLSTFNRPNLSYTVRPKTGTSAAIIELLQEQPEESAIIYCASRKDVERMTQTLQKAGISALSYHAGLNKDVRQNNQEQFIRDEVRVMVATIAFGMGIDKPDVRLVVHYDLPKSLEGYYQETGRAGRDGLPSRCVLFYSYSDSAKQDFFIGQMTDGVEQQQAKEKLSLMLDFCRLRGCRRAFLMEYFGEKWPEGSCGACDNCLNPQEYIEATEISKKILSAVLRTKQRFGAGVIAGVLRGSDTIIAKQPWLQQLSVFGIVDNFSEDELKQLIRSLAEHGFLVRGEGEYPTFQVSSEGIQFLKGSESVELPRPLVAQKKSRKEKIVKAGKLPGDYDVDLFERLRVLRKRLADELGVPPFIVFGDASLRDMCVSKPKTLEQFAEISGVGEKKLVQFGEVFLKEINDALVKA